MKNSMILGLSCLSLIPFVAASGCGGDSTTSPPTGVRCFFIQPHDGDVVSSLVDVKMGAENFTIKAENYRSQPGIGHFALIDGPCVIPGSTLIGVMGSHDLGDGETETKILLTPGKHHLCLQLVDGAL